jgi:broad specificity phosphatase PhoE
MTSKSCHPILVAIVLGTFFGFSAFNVPHSVDSFSPSLKTKRSGERRELANFDSAPFGSLVSPLFSISSDDSMDEKRKRIVFIRHGRTHMNDLIGGINYGGPNFTDIFPEIPEYNRKYRDSPLGPTGLIQVMDLSGLLADLLAGKEGAQQALSLSDADATVLDELDLVVVSPLVRALQTMEFGLLPHIRAKNIPIVAVPQAAERLYLVSDIGKPRSELELLYDYVDFDTAFDSSLDKDDPWHFSPTEEEEENYVEWRPHDEGQQYFCLGEPQKIFDFRMQELLTWLKSRDESTIAVICHWGVIDWMIQESFENCELRVVQFDELKPRDVVVEELAVHS